MKTASQRLIIPLVLGVGLTLLGLMAGRVSRVTLAQSGTGVIRVATTGHDVPGCGSGTNPCHTVQYAVDQALPGAEIRVATGVYTGVNTRGGLAQVVYVSKTVSIRGGYPTGNWATPDPVNSPTTLDAQGQGRVLLVTGDISPTVEGLRITGGDARGLDGGRFDLDAGGGVYVYTARAIISNCVIYSNTASTASPGFGGGVYLKESAAVLNGNTVLGNIASMASYGFGGGVYLEDSAATLSDNVVQGNVASIAGLGHGGGLYFWDSGATLSGNTVRGNVASTASDGYGGGLRFDISDNVALSGNTIRGNVASTAGIGYGGGLFADYTDYATLSGNAIVSNTATLSPTAAGRGGGLYVRHSSPFTLVNDVVADNHANTEGSGLWFTGDGFFPTSVRLLHTTIADGRGSGQGVFVGAYTTLAFTNTILAGHHSVGVTVTTGSRVTLEATLWYGNGSDTGGGGTVISNTNVTGAPPGFANPAAWDYHLRDGSAAIDEGVNAGVTIDIDGDPRPAGTRYDLGADEFWHKVYTPLVMRQYDLSN